MDWPVAAVLMFGSLCATACYLVPYWAPKEDKSSTERTPAIGFHVGHNRETGYEDEG